MNPHEAGHEPHGDHAFHERTPGQQQNLRRVDTTRHRGTAAEALAGFLGTARDTRAGSPRCGRRGCRPRSETRRRAWLLTVVPILDRRQVELRGSTNNDACLQRRRFSRRALTSSQELWSSGLVSRSARRESRRASSPGATGMSDRELPGGDRKFRRGFPGTTSSCCEVPSLMSAPFSRRTETSARPSRRAAFAPPPAKSSQPFRRRTLPSRRSPGRAKRFRRGREPRCRRRRTRAGRENSEWSSLRGPPTRAASSSTTARARRGATTARSPG